MPTREEKFLMKQRMKEHRHQARLEEERRKRELAEIKYLNAKRRSENRKSLGQLLFSLLPLIVIGAVIAFYVYMFVRHG